ncbi:GNAT family N-acetyltransferase [Planosporangium sp. 12N6]|uniref:GNAT family N-acetyltransferase n=1 Tax=Planosporangium spinosum TaxID=3402278 RepID=UPI003CEFAD56
MALHLTVTAGVPADWPVIAADAPAPAARRWIELGFDWLPGEFHSFVLRDDSGRGVAAIGGAVVESAGSRARLNPHLVLSGGTADIGLAVDGPHPWQGVEATEVFPTLLLNYPNYASFPVGPGRDDPAVLKELVGQILHWAAERGINSVTSLFLYASAGAFIDELASAGFALVKLTDTCDLAVTWASFDGYLQSLGSKRRIEVNRELRTLRERGVGFTARRLLADEPEILDLRCQLAEKYDGTSDPQRERRILQRLRDHVDPADITVFTADKDGEMLGFGLFVKDGSEWTAAIAGTNYRRPDSEFTYFANLYYQPAAAAPEAGVTTIGYGPGSWDAKRRRGCHLSPLYAAGVLGLR